MRIVFGVNFFRNKLVMAVTTMVQGIKNSTHLVLIVIISLTLRNNVIEWPMVNAVTRISTCFQSLIT